MLYYREDVTEDEGIECKCTCADSPGELYVQPLNLADQLAE